MSIFNSLGSNYSLASALQMLFRYGGKKNISKLGQYLSNRYGGEVTFLYKGRDALEYILAGLDMSQDASVAINGYTCYVVNRAIQNAGLHTTYLDIGQDSLHFSAETLSKALVENKNIRVVVIQNTLGCPCDIEGVAQVCRDNNIILIEDLAHSIGAVYADGIEAGNVGDFTILSFGQDKVIDVVSGGAIVQRNSQYILRKTELIDVPFFTQLRDRIYPMITWLVRKTYAIGLGKIIHKVAKNTGLLQSPVLEKEQANRALPNSYHGVIYNQFQKLELLSQHRKKIADIYASEISSEYTYNDFVTKLNNSANLRFPLRISNRDSLVQYLQDRGIYISDIWYDAPIAPKKYLGMVPYNNECPQAAETSGVMVNLPTHCNISIDTAYTISRHINQWIQSQDAQ